MIRYRIFICAFCFFIVHTIAGQYSNLRCKWIKPSESGVRLDTLSIVPGSIEVKSAAGYTSTYDVNSNLLFISPAPLPDSLLICYRVYPFDLSRKVYKRDLSLYDSIGGYREVVRMPGNVQQREELFTTPGINKTGVISRGVSVGNNQSVFVNSTLNLQLDGKLSDDVMLTAVISDQNIPFQPDGNTQQLQQFDRVYIQLKGRRTTLTAGDIVLSQQSYFLNYYRNIQGGHIKYVYKKDSVAESVTQGGIGVSKGKFNSMQFAPGTPDALSEGVQGPYRLRGPNGERFIIVIANSEKIYLDGRLLTRGFDYDYVIDYNTAEITFTPRILITKYTRVRVDFEFSDKNYARTNTAVSQTVKTRTGQYGFYYYSEKDNPRNPLTLDLSLENQLYLAGIGDNLSQAFLTGVDSVGYSNNSTLYRKYQIGTVDVYEYSTNPDSAFFQVRFSQVASGTGSYILDNSTTNARVYRYVGAGLGDYEPVQYVPTPKQKQMVQGSLVQNINKYDQFFGDLAFSDNDINLYSDLDKENDQGVSFRGGYKTSERNIGLLPKYTLSSLVSYEYNQKNFAAIDRFRSPDFERYWNENTAIIGNNNMISGNIKYAKNTNESIGYTLNYRDKEGDIKGLQHLIQFNQHAGKLFLKADAFYSQTQSSAGNAGWQRYNTNLFYTTKWLTPGFQYNTEKNSVQDSSGSIIRSLMYFEEYKFYIHSNDTSNVRIKLDQSFRNDKEVFDGSFRPNTQAQTTNFFTGLRFNPNHQLNLLTTYRYLNSQLGPTPLPNEETFMGRVDWNISALKRHVRSELTVTTGTGREVRKQFVFQPVATGLGTHVWRDFNDDGKQEINEFVEKIYNDTLEFIKVYLPVDDYYKAFTNAVNYRLDLMTPRSWRTKDAGILKLFSKLSNTSSLTLNKRTTDRNIINRFNPLEGFFNDTTLLGYQRLMRSTFFFNRSSSLYGLDIAFTSNQSRQFLTQGFENRIVNDIAFGARMTFKRMYAIKTKLSTGYNNVSSDFNAYRNFDIEYKKISNEFSYQPRTNLRVSVLNDIGYKVNVIEGGNGENTMMYSGGMEIKWNKLSRRTFTAASKYIRIDSRLNGTPENSPVAYEMQEALLNGNNMTWTVAWQERLTNGLQLSFSYEGRKSEAAKMIHTGRMQLSALF